MGEAPPIVLARYVVIKQRRKFRPKLTYRENSELNLTTSNYTAQIPELIFRAVPVIPVWKRLVAVDKVRTFVQALNSQSAEFLRV